MTKFEGPEESFRPANSTDSAFKLFGRTIPVRTDEIGGSSPFSSGDDGDNHNNNNNGFRGKVCGELEDDKTSSGEEINGEPDERHEEKMRKKTSKPVACPRCDSMDTKFCYFNNYSVNQPRHYCRNCQRYWTAGGSLRNVPVGAGRRKNKPSLGIHHAHIVEGDQCVWNEGQDFIPGNSEKLAKVEAFRPELDSSGQALNAASCSTEGNSKPKPGNYSHSETLNLPKAVRECFLSFGRGMDGLPRPESSTILPQGLENFQKPDCTDGEKTELSPKSGESAEHPVDGMRCGSSVTVSGSVAKEPPAAEAESGPGGMRSEGENKADAMNWGNGCYPPFAGSPWPLYHNGSWAPATPGIHGVRGVQTSGMPWCQPGTGFLPAVNGSFPSYLLWGQAWGMPWRPANADSSPTALGKHQRDEMPLSESKCDGSLWAPKTLRINDPADAVRSSIWASLGLGKKPGFINSDGILKAFQPKMEDIASAKTTPVQILGASPAALSRSASFVESS